MTVLRLVGDNEQHSVRVPKRTLTVAQVAERERITRAIYMPGSKAITELVEALANDLDDHELAVALKRLSSIGELARHSALRLEGSLRV